MNKISIFILWVKLKNNINFYSFQLITEIRYYESFRFNLTYENIKQNLLKEIIIISNYNFEKDAYFITSPNTNFPLLF